MGLAPSRSTGRSEQPIQPQQFELRGRLYAAGGAVDVTDPRGYVRRIVFGATGYMTSDSHALNQPEQQTVTYAYYADNSLQSVDSLGRVTSFVDRGCSTSRPPLRKQVQAT